MRPEGYLILFFLLLLSGCLSGPLPEDLPKTPAPITSPPPTIESLSFISFASLSFPDPDPEFGNMTPEIEGLFHLPYFNPVDVVSNDLSVLNHPRRLQILASVVTRYTVLYVQPKDVTDTMVYFTIYKMDDPKTGADVLEAYKGTWNKRPLNVSGGEIWVWEGYIDEMEGRAAPFSRNSIVYWNPEARAGFLSEKVLKDHPALTRPESALYSVHGETTYGPYFIMIDVKTQLQDIQDRATAIFSQAIEGILRNKTLAPPQTSPPPVNASSAAKIERIREDLHNLLESFLSGNITKEEYDVLFEQYGAELKNLTNSTGSSAPSFL
ncbi:MAG: hypothetical protein ACE5HH_04225 [Candidatus Hydrothermarchaeales archaeon]